MSFGKFIDEQIKKAIDAGEFDNLENAGKPVSLDDYFNTPEDLRVGYSVLKSSKFVPEEVERLREIGQLRERVKNCADEAEKKRLTKILSECQLAFDILMERKRLRR